MAKGLSELDIELADYLDGDELDAVKALLSYLLIDGTDLDGDTVYSLVFQSGKKIVWH